MSRDYKYHPNAFIVHGAVQDEKTTPEYFEEILKNLTQEDKYRLHENHISLGSLIYSGNPCIKNIILLDVYGLDVDRYGVFSFLKTNTSTDVDFVLKHTKQIPLVIESIVRDCNVDSINTNILQVLLDSSNIKDVRVNDILKTEIKNRNYWEEVRIHNEARRKGGTHPDAKALAVWVQKTFGGIPLE